jgi:hypothetical protein
MFRTALMVGGALLAIGTVLPVRAQTLYRCVPDETRVTAPDRLVSVEITLRPNGEFASVLYRAANGAAYDRGKQYETRNSRDATGQLYWVGTLRANPNVAMVGSLNRKGDDRLVYFETIHDKLQGGKVVSQVTSICEAIVAEATPPQTPAARPPPVSFPDPEFKALLDCIDAAAVGLAIVSSEPAQTIVDAALGECPHERRVLENALERQGVAQPVALVDEVAKEVRPNLLALVLNARVAAARPSGGPAKSEPAKGQPL